VKDAWNSVCLGEILRQVSRTTVVEPNVEYKLLGVRLNGRGPFLREIRAGSDLSSKVLYQVRDGDFIYSRLFAWRGAFGVIGNEYNGCYVSNEFPTFRPQNDKIDIRYLNYWFRLSSVVASVEADSSGSTPLTRNRYKEQFLLRLEIPLPSLSEQLRIVTKIEQIYNKIRRIRQLQEEIEKKSMAMLRSTFRMITKNVQCLPMSRIAPLVRRSVDVKLNESYPELGIRSFGKGTFHKPAISGVEVGSKRLYWINPGDVVFNNVFAWEGAVAIARKDDNGRVGSHRFITCVPNSELVTAEYINFYFLTEEGLDKLGEASPGGAGRNRTLGLKKLDTITVPVVNLDVQNWFNALQTRIERLKNLQTQAVAKIDALLPAIVDRAFKGELLGGLNRAKSTLTPYKDDAAIVCIVLDELLKRNRTTDEFFIQKHIFGGKYHWKIRINSSFDRKAAGPWSRELKEKAIFAGQKTNWFEWRNGALVPGKSFNKGVEYAKSMLGDQTNAIVNLVKDLEQFGPNGLSRWMTVLKVVEDLKDNGEKVTRQSIQNEIDNWPGKRKKELFNEENVDYTINKMCDYGWIVLDQSQLIM